MPERSQIASILARSQGSLVFSVKAHESLTHTIDPSNWQEQVQQFCYAIEPLATDGKLVAILLQFPYSFHYEVEQRRYLDKLLKALEAYPLAVEFRNQEWFNNRCIDSLRERKVCLVSLDMPPLKGLPPVLDVATAPFAYFRLHGRNGETWWGSDAAERYNYLYSEQELNSLVERIRLMLAHVQKVLVYFNNHRRGQAVQNGTQLLSLLEAAGLSKGTLPDHEDAVI
jgi:uncharacterized protein YecE (DUF72 family)